MSTIITSTAAGNACAIVVLSDEDKKARNRVSLATAFGENEFYAAAEAVESDLVLLNGHELGAAMKAIREATKSGGAVYNGRDWSRVAWAIYYQIKVMADKESEDRALFFLRPLLNALSALGNDVVSNDIIHGAEMALENALPIPEWKRWALEAVDRLIAKKELVSWDESAKAEDFLSRLHKEINAGINSHRDANRQRKEAKRANADANRALRTANCQKRRGTSDDKPLEGKGKKRPRSANDPHRSRK